MHVDDVCDSLPFDPSRFLRDAVLTATALGAPFSASRTEQVLETFEEGFRTGAVLWKTTSRRGDHLSYRFFARRPINTTALGVSGGLIRESALTSLVDSWREAVAPAACESCDFDCANGMAKTWMFLGAMHRAEDVLDSPALPRALREQVPELVRAGLTHVRFVAVDYRSNTANVYFRARGPVSPERCAEVLKAVDLPAPHLSVVAAMEPVLPRDFCLAVTFSMDSGTAERASFYALGIPPALMPALPDRLTAFFEAAPNHDEQAVRAIGWSQGRSGLYLKAEQSYCGDMAERLRAWDCYPAGSLREDPVLAHAQD